MRPLRLLLLVAEGARNATFSYQVGWPRFFLRDPRYRCTLVNLDDRAWAARLAARLRVGLGRFDAAVLLHSVFSNACSLQGSLREAVGRLGVPKAFFIGNEYKLMPEKMSFCDELGVALLVTQSHSERVHQLYRERLRCAVAGIPNTGLDPDLFQPRKSWSERSIDLGYRSQPAPLYLGHDERERICAVFGEAARRHGLRADLSLDPAKRLAERAWAAFLDDCKGQLGSEAGGDYFELDDATRLAVIEYQRTHPAAGIAELQPLFFTGRSGCTPMRIISGRNVEAAGTRTAQILMQGEYGGYFQPGVHYIPVRRDLADADEAIRQFLDQPYSAQIAENARRVVLEQLTYPRLLDRFDAALRRVV